MHPLRLTPAIAGLPVGRRYRVPIRERFEVAGIQIERRLDPGGTSAAVMVGGAGGALLEAVRRAGRWGAGTGGWVFLCPRCGASVRALEHADDGWGCAITARTGGPSKAVYSGWRGAPRGCPDHGGWESRAGAGSGDPAAPVQGTRM